MCIIPSSSKRAAWAVYYRIRGALGGCDGRNNHDDPKQDSGRSGMRDAAAGDSWPYVGQTPLARRCPSDTRGGEYAARSAVRGSCHPGGAGARNRIDIADAERGRQRFEAAMNAWKEANARAQAVLDDQIERGLTDDTGD